MDNDDDVNGGNDDDDGETKERSAHLDRHSASNNAVHHRFSKRVKSPVRSPHEVRLE